MSPIGPTRTSGEVRYRAAMRGTADLTIHALICGAGFMSTRPSVMGPVMSSLPSDRHAAELTLLSVVGAEAATLCCQKER